jgi:hypothetical protein
MGAAGHDVCVEKDFVHLVQSSLREKIYEPHIETDLKNLNQK